ncbi:MAG: DUF2267 domain-containing protein [Aetokthonos hydrillicola CCALA 1050]|jgi:uncharacterized protein (DUF2267 family)|nr:DUF2267 domain-containing protein [Aetokthonos hydrillicola CCALA 1050]MBW4587852.1 DUF2267 domain-containing protein [Aetokthonos hydrillicola CCALA 1050]
MPISIQRDVVYNLLKNINETGQGKHEVDFSRIESEEPGLTETDLLGHLDYLNQNEYINADFTNDGRVHQVEITDQGRQTLQRLEDKAHKTSEKASSVAINEKDLPFLEKVMAKGHISDIFDARDVTEVVFRVMRDLMTTEAADHVESELHKEATHTEDKALQMEIADLWHDTNPIVGLLSRVRPPWQGPGIFKIDSDRFLFRVANEGGLQPDVNREQVVKAVFSATKDELSQERIEEIASWLPDHVRELWEQA